MRASSSDNLLPLSSVREIIIYHPETNDIKVEVLVHNESLWLTQDRMSELFDIDRSVITKHLLNIFDEGEFDKRSTSAKFAQVRRERNREVTRQIDYYNLDAIIAVGYRVNSKRATQFWMSVFMRNIRFSKIMIPDIAKGLSNSFGNFIAPL
ncbi:RhuM family protein [Treponema primitia]|uniref:virulence RhuM family protein n=1 Tax=Treponema primitia TaxID=88058 RepID=UPI0002555242